MRRCAWNLFVVFSMLLSLVSSLTKPNCPVKEGEEMIDSYCHLSGLKLAAIIILLLLAQSRLYLELAT